MRIDLALLADYALVDKMDKLTAAGIFRRVAGTTIPFTHGPIFLALIMTTEIGDEPHHKIVVRLIDPDGQSIIPELRAELDIHPGTLEAGRSLNFVLQLKNVMFNVQGPHCFDIFVDDRFMERVPLQVALAKIKGPEPAAEK